MPAKLRCCGTSCICVLTAGRELISGPDEGRAPAVKQRGPKRGESDRNGQAFWYGETLIISDVSGVGRFGQDRRTTVRIPLGLFQKYTFQAVDELLISCMGDTLSVTVMLLLCELAVNVVFGIEGKAFQALEPVRSRSSIRSA